MRHNPFATRFTRPSAMPFLMPEHMDIETLGANFISYGYCGQIVGPHGCGKTTLTYLLQSCFQTRFRSVRRLTIRTHPTLDLEMVKEDLAGSGPSLLVVDGIERIAVLQRWLLIRSCRALGTALLVTSHRRVLALPVLCELEPNSEILDRIVRFLDPNLKMDRHEIETTLYQSRGNIREALMRMYDWYEANAEACERSPALQILET